MNKFAKSLVGFITGLTGLLAVAAWMHLNVWGKDAAPVFKVEAGPARSALRTTTSYAPVVHAAAPSVVNIFTTRIVHDRVQRYSDPFHNDPFFRQFFGGMAQPDEETRTRKEQSLGSGVIVSANGYILTANHVVEDADVIKVAIKNSKKEYAARVVGKDKLSDVAVLKIEATGLPAITLADSEQLQVGDVVLAIGNPFGVGQTVTLGIVSALGRNGMGFGQYEDFIQTDAAINPGNSGGALVDADGRLVGINTGIISPSGGNLGIGFAVPVNMARRVMEHLIADGRVKRGFLGVMPKDLTPDLAEEFNLPGQSGALVDDVVPNAPAQKAGLKSGDIITAVNGKPVTSANSLTLAISDCAPGSTATIDLIREGKAKTSVAILAELPLPQQHAEAGSAPTESAGTDSLDGVMVDELDYETRRELGVPASLKGVLVREVAEGSNAAEAGLARWDVILEIDRHPVTNTEEAIRLSKEAKGDHILVKVWHRSRGQMPSTHYLSVDNTKPVK